MAILERFAGGATIFFSVASGGATGFSATWRLPPYRVFFLSFLLFFFLFLFHLPFPRSSFWDFFFFFFFKEQDSRHLAHKGSRRILFLLLFARFGERERERGLWSTVAEMENEEGKSFPATHTQGSEVT